MSTVSEHSQTYADPDEFIQFQVDQARSRIKSTDLMTAGVLTGFLLIGYVLTFTLLDHWVVAGGFRPVTRAVMLAVVLTLCLGIAIRFIVMPWFRRIHPLYAARMLDKSSEGLEGSLLALVDLKAAGYPSDTAIHKTLEKRAALKLAEVHIDEVIDRRWLIRMGTALFTLTMLTCLYAVFSPKSMSLLRPLTLSQTQVATRTILDDIRPGDATIPAGTHVEFQVDISGVVPEQVQILYSTADKKFVDEVLTMQATEDDHRYKVLMTGEGGRGVRQDITYRVVAGDAYSSDFTIRVEQPPSARVTEVQYKYPQYMKLPDRTDNSGAIEGWEDTVVTIKAESNVPLKSAVLELSDDASFKVRGEEVPVQVNGTALTATMKLEDRSDGTFPKFYRIQVTDEKDNHDPEPAAYPMEIRRDQAPIVRLLDPSRDLEVPANAIVPLLVEVEDPDFLLRNVTLNYSVNGQPRQPGEVLLDTAETGEAKKWTGSWDFRLELLQLNDGDVVTYHIQARDNRPPLGNMGRSSELNLLIKPPVSEEEVQQQLDQDRELQQQQVKDRQNKEQNGEAAEQPQPGEGTENPQNDQANPQEGNQPGDNPQEGTQEGTEPGQDGASGNSTGKNGDARKSNGKPGDQKNGQASDQQGNADEDSGNQTADPKQNPNSTPGQNPQGSGKSKKAGDDEALQRLLDSMKEKPKDEEDSQSESSSGDENKNGDGKTDDTKAGENKSGSKADDTKAGENKNGDGKADDTKSGENKNGDGKADDTKAGENKNGGSKADDTKAGENKNGDGKADDTKAGENKNGDGKADDTKAGENKNGDGKADDSKAGENKNGDGKADDTKAGENKNGDSKADDTKAGENKNGDGKADDTKAGENKNGDGKADDTKAGENKNGDSKADDTKAGENNGSKKSDDSKNGDGKQQSSNENGTDGKQSSTDNKAGMNSSAGAKGDRNKTGKQSSPDGQGNEKEPSNANDSKSGDSKSDDSKSDDSKSDDSKSGDSKSGDSKSGDSKSGDSKGGDSKGGDSKGGDSKGGDSKGGDSKGGDSKGGDSKSGDSKGGDSKNGDSKGGESKEGDSKGGDSKGGDSKGGDSKNGDSKGGESKEGDSKSGDSKGGESKEGEQKEGESKGGGEPKGGEQKGGAGGKSGGKPKSNSSGRRRPNGRHADGPGNNDVDSEGAEDQPMSEGDDAGKGRPADGDESNNGDAANPEEQEMDAPKPTDEQVEQSAQAAGLALRRLQKELERGEVDQKLLDELGWTQEELQQFVERMQKQLDERKLNEQQQKEKDLSQKSFEEMLRSLDLESSGSSREGKSERDRDRQDTTNRQSAPPARYKQMLEAYQRSLSKPAGAKGK